jgi:hypothetical protein
MFEEIIDTGVVLINYYVKLKKFSAISWLEQDDDDVLFVLQQQPC